MRKPSSSSLKKKRSKISSSQARIKKRSKSRTRRNNKSKKLRRRDDSVSYSSDSDDSRSSVSVSSCSFEDDYRSRRSRSRTRKDVKGSNKRTRRRSSSDEMVEDAPHVKKQKWSKRSDDFQVRKKTHEKKKKKKKKIKKRKKKSKTEMSVSYMSSGSWSCSTCRSGSDSSDENEVENSRGRSGKKDKDRRSVEKVKSGTKRRRSRSRSCSSCSRYSDYRSDEQLTGEVNLRRLRSVITVAREGNEEGGRDKDEHKEEMVYDHDDYPASRSNDSDGGSKRELAHNSHVASEKKKHAEDEKGEVAVSNIRSGKVTGADKGSDPCDEVGMYDAVKEKKNEDSGVVDSPNAYDLESILRQRALENLKTFRKEHQTDAKAPVNQKDLIHTDGQRASENLKTFQRGHQTDAKAPINQKDLIDSDVKRLSTPRAELFQNKSPKGGGVRVVVASQVAEESSIPAASEGSMEFLQNDKNISDGNNGGKDYGAKHDAAHPPDQVALTSSPNGRVNVTFGSESYKPRLISLASRREPSNACTNKKQAPAFKPESPEAKSLTRNNIGKSIVETAQTVNPQIGRSNDEEVNSVSASGNLSSCSKSISGGINSNKPQDEAKEDSQFEQKTMTVMRGGEMVEVSYKVYIPKKAPALSRRPLKR